MPSPVGHALGGIAAAFVVDSLTRRPVLTLPLLAASAVIAVTPDLDILAGSHRTYSHSIGAVAVVGVIAWMILRARRSSGAPAATLAAAYASHLLLDWLSKDTSDPSGLMALWPFTAQYFTSGWNVFGEISRRYWLPEEFVFGNIRAAGWELVLVGPFALLAWIAWSKRTLRARVSR
jgi:inner membrane protein